MTRFACVTAAALAVLAPLSEGATQSLGSYPAPPPQQPPTHVHTVGMPLTARDRVAHLAVNGALGGFSAGMYALVRGKNPWRAALMGFGGGVVMGGGKQLAGVGFYGSGLLGRQLSALGTSVVRSASEDTMLVLLPVGPVTYEIRPGAADRVRSRVNIVGSATILYYVIRSDTRIDVGASLSAGAPVFRFPTETVTTRDGIIFGRMDFGTIVLGTPPSAAAEEQRMTLPHESIHVVQYDFLEHALTLPPERAILRKLGVGERFLRHVDIGIVSVLLAGVLQMHMDYDERPWEREAVILTEGR